MTRPEQPDRDKLQTLKVSNETLAIIEHALDLFTRTMVGQLDELPRYLDSYGMLKAKEMYTLDDYKELVKWLKYEMQQEAGCFLGIAQKEVADDVKAMYDVQKIIQRRLWEDGYSHEHSVWRAGAILNLSKTDVFNFEENTDS